MVPNEAIGLERSTSLKLADKLKNQTAPATPRSFFTAAGHMNDTDL